MEVSDFKKLVKQADIMSKEKIIYFIECFYENNGEIFDWLDDIDILSIEEAVDFFATYFSIDKELILDKIYEKLGDSEAVYFDIKSIIYEIKEEKKDLIMDEKENGLTQKEIEKKLEELEKEWSDKKIEEKFIKSSALIVYDEIFLASEYEAGRKSGENKRLSIETINEKFIKVLSHIFTHERIHANNDYLISNGNESEFVNGAMKSSYSEKLDSKGENDVLDGREIITEIGESGDKNEVFIDTLAQIINFYEEGKNIEECLHEIINRRGYKSGYEDFDDTAILISYILFPNELTDWGMFGAYGHFRENLLDKILKKIFKTDKGLTKISKKTLDFINEKALQYCERFYNRSLSEQQLEMLEMLGVFVDKEKIKVEDDQKKFPDAGDGGQDRILSVIMGDIYRDSLYEDKTDNTGDITSGDLKDVAISSEAIEQAEEFGTSLFDVMNIIDRALQNDDGPNKLPEDE